MINCVAPGQGATAVAPQQIQPQQIQPRAASPVPPVRPTLPPHVERDASGQLRPEDGYDWLDGNHVSVRWMPGKISRQYPHVIASDTEGKWEPDDGYDWARSDRIQRINRSDGYRELASNRYPNVVAATIEGQWRPADGYTWVAQSTPFRRYESQTGSSARKTRFSNTSPITSLSEDLRIGLSWSSGLPL